MAAIAFENVSKRYGEVTVLDGLDLEIAEGSSSPSSDRAAAANPPCSP